MYTKLMGTALGQLSHYQKEERPWGYFERFTLNEPSTVKIIFAKPNEILSLQLHHKRDEFWQIVTGSGTVTIGDEAIPAQAGDTFYIPRTTKHRIAGGESGIRFLEIAFGEFDENDIERFEDRYGRT